MHPRRQNPGYAYAPTVTAETIARHDEKTSVGRAKVLSGGDTGYRLAEVDEVLGGVKVSPVAVAGIILVS